MKKWLVASNISKLLIVLWGQIIYSLQARGSWQGCRGICLLVILGAFYLSQKIWANKKEKSFKVLISYAKKLTFPTGMKKKT